MKINKISILKHQLEISEEIKTRIINIYDASEREMPSISIIMMPNSSGKSLLFNGLANFLSFDKEPFIKDTDKDL